MRSPPPSSCCCAIRHACAATSSRCRTTVGPPTPRASSRRSGRRWRSSPPAPTTTTATRTPTRWRRWPGRGCDEPMSRATCGSRSGRPQLGRRLGLRFSRRPGRQVGAILRPMSRPPAYLFVGPEELLLRRAADRLLAELRDELGELELTELRASELPDGQLPDLRTGSLFGSPRVVVVREAEALPADTGKALARELEGSPPDATVVLLASATGRLQQLAKVIKAAGGRIDVVPPREWAIKEWQSLVAAEFRHHGRTADAGAAVVAELRGDQALPLL